MHLFHSCPLRSPKVSFAHLLYPSIVKPEHPKRKKSTSTTLCTLWFKNEGLWRCISLCCRRQIWTTSNMHKVLDYCMAHRNLISPFSWRKCIFTQLYPMFQRQCRAHCWVAGCFWRTLVLSISTHAKQSFRRNSNNIALNGKQLRALHATYSDFFTFILTSYISFGPSALHQTWKLLTRLHEKPFNPSLNNRNLSAHQHKPLNCSVHNIRFYFKTISAKSPTQSLYVLLLVCSFEILHYCEILQMVSFQFFPDCYVPLHINMKWQSCIFPTFLVTPNY